MHISQSLAIKLQRQLSLYVIRTMLAEGMRSDNEVVTESTSFTNSDKEVEELNNRVNSNVVASTGISHFKLKRTLEDPSNKDNFSTAIFLLLLP